MSYCTNCGTKLNDTAKFCKNCGKKVNTAPAKQQTPPSKSIKKQNKKVRNVVIGSLILIVGLLIIKSISSGDVKGNPYDKIEIDDSVSNFVDKNLLVQKCEFNDELKVRVKKILSDKNPDPKNLDGQYCGTESHPCKYCGKQIQQNTIYITKQERIENMLKDPESNLGIGAISLIDENWNRDENNNAFLDLLSSLYNVWTQDMKNEVTGEFEMLCNDFETGNKYECIIDGDYLTFCSLKCRDEFELFH